MSSEAICTSCGQDRVLGGFVSVAADYDLKIYQCKGCLTHTWLVSKKSASNRNAKRRLVPAQVKKQDQQRLSPPY
jgi:hypothetical protein